MGKINKSSKSNMLSQVAIMLLLGNNMVSADQPVNCLRTHLSNQVWNFHVSKSSETINLFETEEVCTHKIPNKV